LIGILCCYAAAFRLRYATKMVFEKYLLTLQRGKKSNDLPTYNKSTENKPTENKPTESKPTDNKPT